MGFNIITSNRLELLSERLSKNIKRHDSRIFEKEHIVTQTSGMSSWLSASLAHKKNNGIFANFDYLNPNDFISRIYCLCGGNRRNLMHTEKLKWILYALLLEDEFITAFPDIAGYYTDDDSESQEEMNIKRIQLSLKLADLFDQYQIYRPDLIESWNTNTPSCIVGMSAHEQWQKWLWNKLKMQDDPLTDKTELAVFIKKQIKDQEIRKLIQKEFQQVSFFGFSVFTQFHLDLFSQMGDFIDLNFYLINPSADDAWVNESSSGNGNTLLTGLGKNGRELFSMFPENIVKDQIFDVPVQETLLGTIQNQIHNNITEEIPQATAERMLNDGTVIINSCYTQVREVEVLYNYLVDLLDKKQEKLCPRDVLVIVNDMDKYAPFITAVFDTAPYAIPYTISDRSYSSGDCIIGVLEQIFDLHADTLTSEQLMKLLDSELVKQRFGITDTDFLRNLILEANIRFGEVGEEEDDTRYVSWKYGLEKMILGYTIQGGEEYQLDDYSTFPLDLAEGQQAHEMLRLVRFSNLLFDVLHKKSEKKNLNEWKTFILEEVIEQFINVGDDQEKEYRHIINQLGAINNGADFFSEGVSFEVFSQVFMQDLLSETRSGNFYAGRLTFCSAVPLRSIPYRVIAMLGMNKDAFPRKDKKLGFNLIYDKYRSGDRCVKDNDKYLFLETLLAAQKYFYASYLGRSSGDNSSVPPSILIDELLDFVESIMHDDFADKVQHILLQEHPLQGFSGKYRATHPRLFTYFGNLDEEGGTMGIPSPGEGPSLDFSSIGIDELVRFFDNPIKWYFNKSLGIRYDEEDDLLPETELFSLDNLEKWKFKTLLLKATEDETELRDRAVKTGTLPLKSFAQISLDDLKDEIELVKSRFDIEKDAENEQILAIRLEIDGSMISGKIDNIYGDKHICVSMSKSTAKYLSRAWIRHLILKAAGQKVNTVFIQDGTTNTVFPDITETAAKDILKKLLHYYSEGHTRMLYYTVKSGYAYQSEDEDEARIPKAIGAIQFEAYGSEYYPYTDPYIQKAWEDGFFIPSSEEDEEAKKDEIDQISELIFSQIC